jgi:hypothetical protein
MHTLIVDTIIEGSDIKGVIIESKAGKQAVLGKIIIDATGDADIAARAGVPFKMGDKGFMQYPSTLFRMENVDEEKARAVTFPELCRSVEEACRLGTIALPRKDALFFLMPRRRGVVCNVTRVSRNGAVIDGTSPEDLTYAEIEGKKQARTYEKLFREYIPGFEDAFMADAGQIGIRETRILDGEYILKNEDVMEGKKFDDAIARSSWPIALHESEGTLCVNGNPVCRRAKCRF